MAPLGNENLNCSPSITHFLAKHFSSSNHHHLPHFCNKHKALRPLKKPAKLPSHTPILALPSQQHHVTQRLKARQPRSKCAVVVRRAGCWSSQASFRVFPSLAYVSLWWLIIGYTPVNERRTTQPLFSGTRLQDCGGSASTEVNHPLVSLLLVE